MTGIKNNEIFANSDEAHNLTADSFVHSCSGNILLPALMAVAFITALIGYLAEDNARSLKAFKGTVDTFERNNIRRIVEDNIDCRKTFEAAGLTECSNSDYFELKMTNLDGVVVPLTEQYVTGGNFINSGKLGKWYVRARCSAGVVEIATAKEDANNPGSFAKTATGSGFLDWQHRMNPIISNSDGLCAVGSSTTSGSTEVELSGSVTAHQVLIEEPDGSGGLVRLGEPARGNFEFHQAQLGKIVNSEYYRNDTVKTSTTDKGTHTNFIRALGYVPTGNFIHLNSTLSYSMRAGHDQEDVVIFFMFQIYKNGSRITLQRRETSGFKQQFANKVSSSYWLPVTPGATYDIYVTGKLEMWVDGDGYAGTVTWSTPVSWGGASITLEEYESNLVPP